MCYTHDLVNDPWAPTASCRKHRGSSRPHTNRQCKLQQGTQKGCTEVRVSQLFCITGVLFNESWEHYCMVSLAYPELRKLAVGKIVMQQSQGQGIDEVDTTGTGDAKSS